MAAAAADAAPYENALRCVSRLRDGDPAGGAGCRVAVEGVGYRPLFIAADMLLARGDRSPRGGFAMGRVGLAASPPAAGAAAAKRLADGAADSGDADTCRRAAVAAAAFLMLRSAATI